MEIEVIGNELMPFEIIAVNDNQKAVSASKIMIMAKAAFLGLGLGIALIFLIEFIAINSSKENSKLIT